MYSLPSTSHSRDPAVVAAVADAVRISASRVPMTAMAAAIAAVAVAAAAVVAEVRATSTTKFRSEDW